MSRQSPNANGRSVILPDLMFLYSRQRCSRRRAQACRRSASFSWTFGVAPLVAAPRLLKGRSVGKALPHFHSEPYVTLHPRRGFAYIRHFVLRTALFCCAPLTLPCRRIKTRAFLFGWAAHQNSRICGIFFAPRREIPLDAVRQSAGSSPFGRTNFAPIHRKISPQLLLSLLSVACHK